MYLPATQSNRSNKNAIRTGRRHSKHKTKQKQVIWIIDLLLYYIDIQRFYPTFIKVTDF